MTQLQEIILNLGSGESQKGDIRFDINRHGSPDVQGTATKLPFLDASFDRVLAEQVLEHLVVEDVVTTLNEIHRVLRPGGCLVIYVPHASSRLAQQDPTHRSNWTYRTIDYFTDGNFSWYFENQPFEFELVDRELNLWCHPERPFNAVRSKKVQLLNRLFASEDEYAYRAEVDASLRFVLEKSQT